MNKILLLTTLLALAYRATWAQDVSSVAILEYGTALLTKTDELLTSFGGALTIKTGGTLTATTGTGGGSGTPPTNVATTGGSGTGLTLDFEYSTTAVTSVTVNKPGSGYRVGDVITVDKQDIDAAADATVLTLTLESGDFAVQGKVDMDVDALLSGFGGVLTIKAGDDLTATTGASGSATPPTNVATTGGSGTGLTLDFEYGTGDVTSVTVNNPGSRYRVGDVISVDADAIIADADDATVLTLTLTKAHFPGLLRRHLPDILNPAADALLASLKSGDADLGGSLTGDATSSNIATTGGSGTGLTLDFEWESASITSITVKQAGSGYKVGDEIKVNRRTLTEGTAAADTEITITLRYDDFIGGSYRDSVGATKSFVGSALGGLDYYVPLQKVTTGVQVVAQYTSAGSLTASMDATTDATLTTATPSATIFSVSGGLNILKLVSSVDGNYEFNLIKPDENIKHVQGSKRSLEIAYNPGVVGEFTCAAFTNDATPPTTRANVEANGIAKSVRTHNILQENIFNSLQMTLNGLSPSLEYDIYCYHLSHGIISNTATTVKTDLASLTAVSLASTDESGGFDLGVDTVTLTFTHEASLGSGDEIRLSLYTDFDTKQAIKDADATVTDCKSLVAITHGLNTVAVTSCAENGANDLLITLSGSSTVSGSSGNVMTVVLTHNTALQFESNAAAGAKVTFNLEVTGHGKLLQQTGWTTS